MITRRRITVGGILSRCKEVFLGVWEIGYRK
jgi:hypothetical protein